MRKGDIVMSSRDMGRESDERSPLRRTTSTGGPLDLARSGGIHETDTSSRGELTRTIAEMIKENKIFTNPGTMISQSILHGMEASFLAIASGSITPAEIKSIEQSGLRELVTSEVNRKGRIIPTEGSSSEQYPGQDQEFLSTPTDQTGKQRVIELKQKITDAKKDLEAIRRYSKDHEKTIAQIRIYFDRCIREYEKRILQLENFIEESQRIENNQVNTDYINNIEKKYNLADIQKELKRAQNIIEYREKFPTIEDLIKANSHNIPPQFLEQFYKNADIYWRCGARIETAQKNWELKNEQFEYYYQNIFLKAVDQASLNLVKDAQIWMRRRPEALIQTLKTRYGRFITTVEARLEEDPDSNVGSARNAQEKTLHGYPENTPQEIRLLYTYPTNDPDGAPYHRGVKGLGKVAIRLKSEVKERATKLMGNPFPIVGIVGGRTTTTRLDARPVAFNKADRDCCPIKAGGSRWSDHMEYEDPLQLKSPDDVKPWYETHVHLGLTVDDTVEYILYPGIADEVKKDLIYWLDEYHLDYREYKPE
jgi:hypothetical protein